MGRRKKKRKNVKLSDSTQKLFFTEIFIQLGDIMYTISNFLRFSFTTKTKIGFWLTSMVIFVRFSFLLFSFCLPSDNAKDIRVLAKVLWQPKAEKRKNGMKKNEKMMKEKQKNKKELHEVRGSSYIGCNWRHKE